MIKSGGALLRLKASFPLLFRRKKSLIFQQSLLKTDFPLITSRRGFTIKELVVDASRSIGTRRGRIRHRVVFFCVLFGGKGRGRGGGGGEETKASREEKVGRPRAEKERKKKRERTYKCRFKSNHESTVKAGRPRRERGKSSEV